MSGKKILVMGLPGSGKSTFSEALQEALRQEGLHISWYNADYIRKHLNDWDFSDAGRRRQAERMTEIARVDNAMGRWVVCDFVCPKREYQDLFDADILIWMDTIKEGRFEDTNKLFEKPKRKNVTYKLSHTLTDDKTKKAAIQVAKKILNS
tara:strand:+ start:2064 stop:2516 length:453 start_codon:yes stop_codon:yes gene_type:complete